MSLFFSNCAPQSSVSMSVRTECDSKDYLSAGLTQLPSLFFLFSLAYLAFFAFWIYFCYTNRRCVHRIHLLMAGLLLMNALNLISSAEDMHFVKVTGTPHGWDVLFYIFQFIRVVLLFSVIVLVGIGWSFLKPFLQEKEKKVLMIVIPLQVLANIACIFIGETGPFIKDWVTWNHLFFFVDIICCCAIIFPIVWSIRSLRETSKTDGKAARNLSKMEDMDMDFPTNDIGASSSSSTPKWTYDVFLSFRGEDSRYGFTGHLYKVLDASGFYTFVDDEKLPRGEEISPKLLKAIEESKISIVVFSENYATSRWCLEELVKILECKKSNQQMVLPIFYNVHAGEVRNQTGNFGKVMDSYLLKKGFENEKMERWRKALNEAANLSGWSRKPNEQEYKFIERIVKDVSSTLNRAPLHVANYPVGIDSHVLEINKLLQTASDDVRMLGIYGLGGIGKTTIAKAVYNSFFHHFEGHSFLANVKENSKRESDLVQLQLRLLSDMLRNIKWTVSIVDRGINLIKERLSGKKVLLILDDVDRLDQLEKLAIRHDSFGKGSIVIITTRNKHLLTSHSDDFIKYEVENLNLQEAQQLFSWHAFKGNKSMVDYAEFVNRAIRYADGHPLALKVLGSYLCGKSIPVWESALDKCKKIQFDDIHKILKISFDGLEDTEKDVFLDIACFFKGKRKDTVEAMLKSFNFYPESGIATLIDRCLITVEDNRFWMHDLVQQMGREIVRQEPGEPKKRRRLWFHEDNEEDLEDLVEDTGLNKIHGIMLDFPEPKELRLSAKVFKKMTRLRVLIVRNAHFSGGFECLPNRLMWIDWANYPFPLLLDSCSKKCVVLNMPCSHIILKEPLINKFKCMIKMNLRESKFIEKVPDISGMPNLKELDVSYCESLIEVHQSVGFHSTLVSLYLHYCPNLQILPSGLKMKSLMDLRLYGCSRLDKFPNILERMERLTELYLNHTAIKELPSSIEYLTGLEKLVLEFCTNDCPKPDKFMMGGGEYRQPPSFNIRSTENSEISSSSNLIPWPSKERDPHLNVPNDSFFILTRLSMLTNLALENCNLSNLDFLTTLSCTLQFLELSRNNFVTIPKCIYKFDRLRTLELWSCKLLQEIPLLPPKITAVYARDCISLNYESRSRLLDQEFLQMMERAVALPGSEIPKRFNIRSVGSSILLLVNRKISNYSLCIAFGAEGGEGRAFPGDVYEHINGRSFHNWTFIATTNNLVLTSYEITPEIKEFHDWNDWNYIEIKVVPKSPGVIKELGIHVECTCPPQNCCCWKWVDEGDCVESNYPQDSGSSSAAYSNSSNEDDDALGITISETKNMPTHHDEQALVNIDTALGHEDSNDKGKGVLRLPLDMKNVSDPIVSGGEALGSSPLPGSEMGHRVPMEMALDTALGVQSSVNDGFDPIVSDGKAFGSSSIPYSNASNRYGDSVFGWPYVDGFDFGSSSLPKRKRTS